MPLFSSSSAKRASATIALSHVQQDVQPNWLGQYIAALNANIDTRAIVANIKLAVDADKFSSISSVRFQRFLLDHVHDRVTPKDRPRVRDQIKRDFPADPRGLKQVEQQGEELEKVQRERARYGSLLARAEKEREHEISLRRHKEEEWKVARRDANAIIDRLDEELEIARYRYTEAEKIIANGLMALAQPRESQAYVVPRSRPVSQYNRPPSMHFAEPSESAEPRSTSPSDASGRATPVGH